jgi:hypothetical protein
MYMFTLGIFLGSDGHFRNVKVPSSPYKRGVRARVKGHTILEGFGSLWGDSLSPFASLLYLNVLTVLSLVFGDLFRIFGYPPTLVPTVFQPKKQRTMPPQKKSKKNIPAETNQEDHHRLEGNEISFVPEPSNITDQERRAKLEVLMKARAEKTSHIQEQPTEQQTHENDDDDDETIDRELERVQQKIQQLQKEKEKFARQFARKKKDL